MDRQVHSCVPHSDDVVVSISRNSTLSEHTLTNKQQLTIGFFSSLICIYSHIIQTVIEHDQVDVYSDNNLL